MQHKYSFKTIEKKWQKNWDSSQAFVTKEHSKKPKYYILEMFPYPSGKIHMGHVRNYTIGDVVARYKKAKGFNVLHPMGWDSFGLPAENAALEHKIHPKVWTYQNIQEMRTQFQKLGLAIDWTKELITCAPEYYQHEQAMFIEFFKHGLAYKQESWVNWDPIEQTVLANEQVINGKGWRSGAEVQQKQLNQWFLKITAFADELLEELKNLPHWPDTVKNMQANWIGKSFGATINFAINNSNESISVYSTKPETIFGCSYLALSIHHPLAIKLSQTQPIIKEFIEKYQALGTIEENISKEEKVGIETGLLAINPVTNQNIPIYIANYVLNYGTGAVFACPAHDSRDLAFAKKYNLPVTTVVKPHHSDNTFQVTYEAFEEEGILINSGFLNGYNTTEAKQKIIAEIEKHGYGTATTNYRLKDWGVSRQRFWGCPIPIVYCNTCGTVPLPAKDLPVLLPEDNESLSLVNHPTWKYTTCPTCNNAAIRETDTLDTFFESAWYFLRYPTIGKNNHLDSKTLNHWLPVDQYIGGIEHAVMHLLYARFFVKALTKVKLLNTNFTEPFHALLTQGMVCHKTYQTSDHKWLYPSEVIEKADGSFVHKASNLPVIVGRVEKMSKSKKNIVDPNYICEIYGADTARMFVLSDSPPTKDLEWTDEGIEGIHRFLHKLWNFSCIIYSKKSRSLDIAKLTKEDLKIYSEIQKYLFKIETNIQALHLNKALALNRELFNLLETNKSGNHTLLSYGLDTLLQTLNPFVPHITEELWAKCHNKPLCNSLWVEVNSKYLAEDSFILPVQINGKIRGKLTINSKATEAEILELIKKDESLTKYLENITIRKVIYVPKRIINLIV
ncbi:Leucine--tRNA ligase [Candidatus Hepatincola sp. Pdp]